MSEEPLIFTKNGNVPESDLVYSTEWDDHIDHNINIVVMDGQLVPTVTKTGYLVFKERYCDKITGEVMKESAHVYQFSGLPITSTAEQFS